MITAPPALGREPDGHAAVLERLRVRDEVDPAGEGQPQVRQPPDPAARVDRVPPGAAVHDRRAAPGGVREGLVGVARPR